MVESYTDDDRCVERSGKLDIKSGAMLEAMSALLGMDDLAAFTRVRITFYPQDSDAPAHIAAEDEER